MKHPLAEKMGRVIKLLRIQHCISQEELSKKVGCDVSYISLIEIGKRNPSISMLDRIAQALGKPLFLIFYLAEKDTIEIPRDLKEKLAYEVIR